MDLDIVLVTVLHNHVYIEHYLTKVTLFTHPVDTVFTHIVVLLF